MPCYDGREETELRVLQERLDLATRVACELWRALNAECQREPHPPLSVETLAWAREHEAMDRDRAREPWHP
jgi:hypothetical protein